MIETLLWKNHLAFDKLERTRSDTSALIWWLVVLSFIFVIFLMTLGLGSLAQLFKSQEYGNKHTVNGSPSPPKGVASKRVTKHA